MTIVELTLLALLISVISGAAGYLISNSKKVDNKTCLERHSHVQEFFCLQLNHMNHSLDEIKNDIKDSKMRGNANKDK